MTETEPSKTTALLPALKPCPFCGSSDVVLEGNNALGLWVVCKNCECFGPDGKNTAEVIQKWNTRKENTP